MTLSQQQYPGGLVADHFTSIEALGPVLAAITTRAGGCSTGPYTSLNLGFHVGDDPAAVRENRRRVCQAFDIGPFTCPDQRHGRQVAVIDRQLAGAGYGSEADATARLFSVDALVTNVPELALGIGAADCAPVVVLDPVNRAIGIAHAGRRGAILDVLGAMVGAMTRSYGTRPARCHAAIGPCIGGESYEIGPGEVGAVREAFGDRLLTATTEGRARFDLPAAVHSRLVGAGIPREQVTAAGIDTCSRTDRYFSDRAERPCGRMLLVAAIRACT